MFKWILKSVFLSVVVLTYMPELSATDYLVVPVPKDLRHCSDANQCTFVDTLCSSCCGYEAINKEHAEAYHRLLADRCGDYSGAVCDCIASTKTACIDGVCVIQPDESLFRSSSSDNY